MLDKQLIRGIVIFCLLLGATSNAVSQFNNSQLLEKAVKLNKCIKQLNNPQQHWDHYNSRELAIVSEIAKVNKIGAIVHPNPQNIRRVDTQTISISILPYIITKSGKRFYLLPEVPEQMKLLPFDTKPSSRKCQPSRGKYLCTQKFVSYYPACQENSYELADAHPEFYPIVLLSVDNPDDLNQLEQDLRDALDERQPLEFLEEFVSLPINLKRQLKQKDGLKKGMGVLLAKYNLKKKQAKFLEDFPFTVTVRMEGHHKNTAETTSCTELQNELKKITRERDALKKRLEAMIANPDQHIETGQSSGHKLIVVSLSNSRKLTSKAPVIQDGFIEVLSELKQNDSKTQFTLLTIGSGRKAVILLTDADLPSLHDAGHNSISGKINRGMQFGARDLKALADLNLVDQMIQEKSAIKSVLYITDNTRSSDPPNIERGVPLAWYEDGIRLTVLTTKGCDVWEQVKAQCSSWNNKSALKSALKTFLGLTH